MRVVLTMAKKERRQRINLTVDPDIWSLCRKKGQEYDLNWSEIAEEAFLSVLLQLQEIEKIVQSASSAPSDLKASIVKSKLKNYINSTCVELNTELNQELEVQILD